MTAIGSLTIEFSKNILAPAIRGIRSATSQDVDDDNKSRIIQEIIEHDGYFDIEEVISVKVKD